ncbi:MAG TPA: SPOR domain-containing protein [Croceibacterium sp.]|jgi:Flp pilus assembly protein TadD
MAIGTDWTKRRPFAVRGPLLLAMAMVVAAGVPAAAQQPRSRAPAQPAPPPALENLNDALDDLTKAPNDVAALLRAGWASLTLGDTQAALGFFRRAEQAAPANGEAKAGEASALLRLDDPVNAVRLFAAAEAAGAPMARYGSDRGLALDLVGENVAAQRFYRQALALGNDPEVVRRLALSEAISGDESAAEATLLPQLQQQDLSAYRTRAFALAILGKGEEAVSIAEKLLPAELSNRMAPYLRYMPRLTRAQQAAAANLGKFPPASEIGRDDPQIAALSAQNPPPQIAEGGPDSRLVPAGRPLGRSERTNGDRRQRDKASSQKNDKKARKNGKVSVTYAPLPQIQTAAAPVAPPPPPPPAPQPTVRAAVQQPPSPAPAEQPAPAPTVRATVQQPPLPAPVDQPPAPEAAPSTPVVVARLAEQPASAPPQTAAAQLPRPSLSISPPPRAPVAAKPASLADTFAEFETRDVPAKPTASDTVDVTKLPQVREAPKPAARPAAKAKAKPKPPAEPSRVWVQIGTGRNVKALAFTWRRLQKDGGALLARHDAYSAKWGATRRLVTGPYKSEDDAQDAIKALKKKGIDAFEFTSDEGEEVTSLK